MLIHDAQGKHIGFLDAQGKVHDLKELGDLEKPLRKKGKAKRFDDAPDAPPPASEPGPAEAEK